jgi:hypothetical protein
LGAQGFPWNSPIVQRLTWSMLGERRIRSFENARHFGYRNGGQTLTPANNAQSMTGEVVFDPKRETCFEGSTTCRLVLCIRKQGKYSGSGRRSVEL